MEFQADFYVWEVSLQVQITDLQDMAEASEELQKDLEDQCYGQAKNLEWMEEEMATQAKTLDLLQVDHDKLQIEVSRLRVEKEALEKQVASGTLPSRSWRRPRRRSSMTWPAPSRRDSRRLWPRPFARTWGSTFLIAIPPTMSLMDASCPLSWMIEMLTLNCHLYFLRFIFVLANLR